MRHVSRRQALYQAISSGQITTKQELLNHALALGLTVTRNGRDYVGLLGADGRRFRIRFQLTEGTRAVSFVIPRGASESNREAICPRAYWIYVLLAHARDGRSKACYVGQTVNLKRRLREHLTRRAPGRTSFSLFEWATSELVEVRVAVVSCINGNQAQATAAESHWLSLAVSAGYETPDVQRWGRRPQTYDPAGRPHCWPEDDVLAVSCKLADVVEERVSLPNALFSLYVSQAPDLFTIDDIGADCSDR